MYIHEFRSSLGRAPGQERHLHFGPKTVIVGPTQSGKSLIHLGIRSALMWPRPKTANSLSVKALTDALHPAASEGLVRLDFGEEGWLQAEWPRGKTPEWSVGGALNVADPKMFAPTLVVDRAAAFFDQNRKQRYQQLVARYVGAAEVDLTPPLGVGAAGEAAWNSALTEAQSKDAQPIEVLSNLVRLFRSALNMRNDDRKEAEAQVKALGVGQSSPDLLEALDAQLQQARTWAAHGASRDRSGDLRLELASLNARVAEAQADVERETTRTSEARRALVEAQTAATAAQEAAQTRQAALSAPTQARIVASEARIAVLAARVADLEQVTAALRAERPACTCVTCGAPPQAWESVERYRAGLADERAKLVAEWQALYAQQQHDQAQLQVVQAQVDPTVHAAQQRLHEAQQAAAEANSALAAAQQTLAPLQMQQHQRSAQLHELLAEIKRVGGHQPYDGPPVEELEARRADAIKYRDRLTLRNDLDSRVRKAQREKELYRVLGATARERLKTAANSIRDGVLGELGPLMPEGVQIDVDPESDDPLRLLTADHEPYSAERACGFERLSLVLAKAQVMAEDALWSLALLDTLDLNEAGERRKDVVQMTAQAVNTRIFSQAIVTAHDLRAWAGAHAAKETSDPAKQAAATRLDAEEAGWTVVELEKSR